jgi:hypothetical protein
MLVILARNVGADAIESYPRNGIKPSVDRLAADARRLFETAP